VVLRRYAVYPLPAITDIGPAAAASETPPPQSTTPGLHPRKLSPGVTTSCVHVLRGYVCMYVLYISFSFLPLCRQLDDLDSLTHQAQVQVQVLWPWLGPPLTTMQYVVYFRFCGRRRVCQ